MQEELSQTHFLASVKHYLDGSVRPRFQELSVIIDQLLAVIDATTVSLDSIVSHLKALKHYIKVTEGKSLYLTSIKDDYDELIEKGEAFLSPRLFTQEKKEKFEAPPHASIVTRQDDFVREQKLLREQISLDDNPLFHNLLRSIWAYAISREFVSKKIFISYAWPVGNVHQEAWTKAYVERLAFHLTAAGFQVYLDDIQGGAGYPLDVFMEKLKKVDHILLVSSRTMKAKLAKPESGVSQEKAKIIQFLESQDSTFRERIVVPVLLNYSNYCDPLFSSLAEVPMCVDGYLGSFMKLLPRLLGDSKLAFETWFDKQLKSEQMSIFEGVPRYSQQLLFREQLLSDIHAQFDSRHRVQHPTIVLWGESGVGKTELAVAFCHHPQTKARYQKIYWVEAASPKQLKLSREIERHPNCLVVLNDVRDYREMGEDLPQDVDVLLTTTEEIIGLPNQLHVPEFTVEESEKFVRECLGNRPIDKSEYIQWLIETVGCNPQKLHRELIYIKRNKLNIPRYLKLKGQEGFEQAILEIEVLQIERPVFVQDFLQDTSISALMFKSSEQTRAWHVPPQNPNFTGRKKLLDTLFSQLNFQALDNLKPVTITACDGMGGIGKTQLAIEYVHCHRANYRFIAWIPAASRDQIQTAYLELAQHLNIAPEKATPEEIVIIVKQFLMRNPGNLLVFDNAQSFDDVEDFVPEIGSAVLITSRAQDGNWPQTVSVPVFTSNEAFEYVKNVLGERVTDSDELIYQLCEAMGYLPLALAQAVAYIWMQKITIQEFLERFRQSPVPVLASEVMPVLDKHVPVYVTFDLAMRAIEVESPAAKKILSICAFLHHEEIPGFLLKNEGIEEILGLLSQYSLITIDMNYRFGLHQLIQGIIRSNLSKAEFAESCSAASKCLVASFPRDDSANGEVKRNALVKVLLPHLEAILPKIEKNKPIFSPLVGRILAAYQTLGRNNKLCQLSEWALPIFEQYHSADKHMLMLFLLMCNGYSAVGDRNKLRVSLERVRVISERYCNPADIAGQITLLTFFGAAYNTLGDAKESCEAYEKALSIGEQLAPDDPMMGLVLGNLGVNKYETGDPHVPCKLLERALSILERSYGPNHPLVARQLMCLGVVAKRCDLQEKALEINERYFGADHPEVAISLQNLGAFYIKELEVEKAFELISRAYRILYHHPDAGPDYRYTKQVGSALEHCSMLLKMNLSKEELQRVVLHNVAAKKTEWIPEENLTAANSCKNGFLLSNQTRFVEAIDQFETATLLCGDGSELSLSEVDCAFLDEQLQTEMSKCTELKINPAFMSYYCLVALYLFLNQKDKAIEKVTEFQHRVMKKPELLYLQWLRCCYEELDDMSAAEECQAIEMSLTLNAEKPTVVQTSVEPAFWQKISETPEDYLRLAIKYKKENKQAERINCIDKALELSPERPDANFQKAQYLFECNDYSQALIFIEISLRYEVNKNRKAFGYELRARIYFMQSNYDSAEESAALALSFRPEDKGIDELLADIAKAKVSTILKPK